MPARDGALLCITPAPAIDRTAHVERLEHGVVLRPIELLALPGGKGVNAARAATRLGGRVITTGIAGGHAGRWIVEALRGEGLDARWSEAQAESRTTYVTVDRSGEAVLVYERPGAASAAEYEAFLELLERELLPLSSRAIVAGSIPSGLDPAGHARIVEICRTADVPSLVDASGAWLLAALAARPDIVKVGRDEVLEIGMLDRGGSTRAAAIALVDRGARLAVVTDGAGEVAAADAETIWRASVPPVRAVNPVGSGDCFNAAMSLALMARADVAEALRKGVAAGTANALSLGGAMLDPDVAHDLEERVEVTMERR